MKTQEHTAGPWQVLEVMGKRFVAGSPTEDHPYWQKTRHVDVAGDEDYPRKDADLALIAAAPQLLEALEFVNSCQHIGNGICPKCHAVAGAAIRSAKGETL